MAVLTSEVKFYRSAVVSDSAANGGRMGIIESVSGVSQNVFPDVPEAERVAGSTKYRKLFVKIENPNEEALLNTFLFLNQITPADDEMRFFPGTQTDVQSDIGSPDLYGVGQLQATVLAAVSTFVVTVEDWSAGAIFRDGDTIRISDGTNEEIHVISGAPTPAGNNITIDIVGALANGYNSSNTFISSGIDLGDLVGSFDTWVETTGAGTYAEATPGNVVVDSIGGVEQDWTLTFTNSTNFGLVGNTLGSVGSGSIGGDFAPNNANFSRPYLTILSAGWGGTWATGNTITFSTRPASPGIWYERVVPAGAAALAANSISNVVVGESV